MRSLPIIVEKPSHAHDAGLVTADRPDGGFCVNRPQTSPIGVGAPRDEPILPMFWQGLTRVGSGRAAPAPVRRILKLNPGVSLIPGSPWARAGAGAPAYLGSRSPDMPRFLRPVMALAAAAASTPAV
jgi:hypothetical protein